MENRKQILIIRGGETFEKIDDFYEYLRTVKIRNPENDRNWRDWIIWALSDKFDVVAPLMPSKQNADYIAWKIWFERYLDQITDSDPIIIGHSLGATFLLKYFSENTFSKKIKQLHFIAPLIRDEFSLYLEKLGSFNFDTTKISVVKDIAKCIHIWHSKDDDVVPFANAELVKSFLPSAVMHVFDDRKHFNQPAFVELLLEIQKENE